MKYEPVIGLEIHAQIATNTKMFCRCSTDSFEKEPNTNVCPICMGFPGMLPYLNEKVIEMGIMAALALNCKIVAYSKFDRKNYFYPDLPKGFQISQYDAPISRNGYVDLLVEGTSRRVRIHRLHLEDDAGKLTHVSDGTLCDYNRSGVPLMEIVSEPDIFSVADASAYAQELQKILRYVGSSECDMEKGMMRFDANVSLRLKGAKELGVKTEVKNLNSFRALEQALAYEIQRQEEVLTCGEKVTQETRGWDPEKLQTFSQRSKEEAHDYRYFPEPDLPPIRCTSKMVLKWGEHIPELPLARRNRFLEKYGLSEQEAAVLTESREFADYFEEAVKISNDAKKVAAFFITLLLGHLHETGKRLSDSKISAQNLGKLIRLVNDGMVSNNLAKTEIFQAMLETGKDPETVVKERGLTQVSDTVALEMIAKKVIEANADVTESFRKGKAQAIGVLVGQIIKETKGQANPKVVNEILRKLLS